MSIKEMRGKSTGYLKKDLVRWITQELQKKRISKCPNLPNSPEIYKCLESLNLVVLIKVWESIRK